MKIGPLSLSLVCLYAVIALASFSLQAQQPVIPSRPIVKPGQLPGAQKPATQPTPFVPGAQPAVDAAGTPPGGAKKLPVSRGKGGPDDGVTVQHPGVPVREVMEQYQDLTGKIFILDPQIENAQVVIDTPGKLSKDQALEFIEKSLLMNGYAVVPSGDTMVKVLAVGQGKSFAPEGNGEIILDAAKLPKSDQAVSFLLPLNNLKAEDAAQEFSQIMQGHAYAKITPVPNAHALVIYENSATIRAIIELAKQIDVSPTATVTKRIFLERADAEEVSQAISSILGLDSSGSTGSAPRPTGSPAPAAPRPAGNPQAGAAAQAANVVYSSGGQSGAQAEGPAAKIVAIARQNALLVIASPSDLKRIESLVEEFDAESPVRGWITRKVRFMDIVEFADAASKALMRGSSDKGGSTGAGLAGNQTTSTTTRANGNDSSSRSSFGGLGGLGGSYGGLGGSGGFGGGLGGGFGSGMSSGGGSSLQETQMPKMQSILIGKTLVIVDPPNSTIYASGPPEQLKMLDELITQMDNRPPQLILSAIIGEFTVGDDYSFGLDWVRTMESVGQNAFGGVIKTSQSDSSALKDFSAFGGVKDFLPALQGLTLYSQVGKHLNAFVNTLESTKRFHVLQRPYVAAMNHRKATISTGQQLAIPGQTYSNGTTVGNTGTGFISNTQYIPAELKLEIVPHIFDNREVKLEFVQQNLDVSSYTTISGNKVPNLSTQTLQNTVIVPDGATIVLGGLITERDTGNRTGLPFLARIPILKYIFGSTSNNKERRELMIFVQPRIIADGDDYIQRQLEIEQMNQSYPKNKGFAEPGEPAPLMPVFQNGKLVPRGEPISDDQAAAAGHKDVGERMAKIKPKN